MEFEVEAAGSAVIEPSCRRRMEGAADVSISQQGHAGRGNKEEDATKARVPREAALSLEAIRQRAKDGLLVLWVEVGLKTLEISR
ncbi:MAG: hypothetical protein AB1563_12800 [Bacillota bacterium]